MQILAVVDSFLCSFLWIIPPLWRTRREFLTEHATSKLLFGKISKAMKAGFARKNVVNVSVSMTEHAPKLKNKNSFAEISNLKHIHLVYCAVPA